MASQLFIAAVAMLGAGFLSLGALSLDVIVTHNVTQLVSYAGRNVTLDCPAPAKEWNHTIAWLKYNNPLQDVTYRKLRRWSNKQSRTLLLNNLLFADAGNYTCILDCTSTIMKWTYILIVREPEPLSGGKKPSINKASFYNKTVTYGESAVFLCEVTSMARPYIEWYFTTTLPHISKNLTNESDSRTRLKRLRGVTLPVEGDVNHLYRVELQLANLTYAHSGRYICRTFNKFGKSAREAFLTVLPKPTLSRQELENKYMMTFGDKPNLPLALLIAMPVGILVIACAVLVRALERSKQSHDPLDQQTEEEAIQGVKSPAVMNGDVDVAMETLASEENNNSCPVVIRRSDEQQQRTRSFDDRQYNALSSGSQSISTPDDWPATSSEPRDPGQNSQRHGSVNSSSEAINTSPQLELSPSSDALEMDWEGLDLKLTESLELVQMPVEVDV